MSSKIRVRHVTLVARPPPAPKMPTKRNELDFRLHRLGCPSCVGKSNCAMYVSSTKILVWVGLVASPHSDQLLEEGNYVSSLYRFLLRCTMVASVLVLFSMHALTAGAESITNGSLFFPQQQKLACMWIWWHPFPVQSIFLDSTNYYYCTMSLFRLHVFPQTQRWAFSSPSIPCYAPKQNKERTTVLKYSSLKLKPNDPDP